MHLDDFVPRLDRVRPSGKGYVARCPAHEDRNPSLSVWEGPLRLHCKCHAGCEEVAVLRALRLTIDDLFYKGRSGERSSSSSESDQPKSGFGAVVETYIYESPDGVPLHYVERSSTKKFRQGRIVNGTKVSGLAGQKLGLYRLPALSRAPLDQTVYVVEGEKDVHACEARGLLATCNAGGAGKFREDHAEVLRSRPVTIVMDQDAAGVDHARKVAALLDGLADSVRVVQAKSGKDAHDHFASGHSPEEFEAVPAAKWQARSAASSGIQLQTLGELLNAPPEEIEWLVEGLLVMGGTSLTVAKPKVGKSTLLRHLAFCVARGLPFLGRDVTKGAVIYIALEEKRSEIVKQFRAMGCTEHDQIHIHVGAVTGEALAELARVIEELSPVLVIIDPLFKMVRVPDANDYARVTAALEPLTELARQAGAHIALCHHRGKGEREDGDAVLGSTAIFGAVDTLVSMTKRSDRRVVNSTNRYGEDLEDLILILDKETYQVKCGGSLEQSNIEEKMSDIVALLGQEPELTEKDIRERIGGNTGLVPKALRLGLESMRIERSGEGKRGSPYVYRLQNGFSFPVSPLDENQQNEKTRIKEVEVS
jgi:hypothetical protein